MTEVHMSVYQEGSSCGRCCDETNYLSKSLGQESAAPRREKTERLARFGEPTLPLCDPKHRGWES